LLIKSAKELEAYRLPKYEGYSWEFILIEHIRLKFNQKWRDIIFGHTCVESDTYPILRRFLRTKYDEVYSTYDKKRERWPDFFALKKNLFGLKTIAIDSKVNYNELVRFLDQATEFLRYSNYVFQATTSELILEIAEKAKNLVGWERILKGKLKGAGVGLILIDMTSKDVKQVFEGPESSCLDKEEKRKRLAML